MHKSHGVHLLKYFERAAACLEILIGLNLASIENPGGRPANFIICRGNGTCDESADINLPHLKFLLQRDAGSPLFAIV